MFKIVEYVEILWHKPILTFLIIFVTILINACGEKSNDGTEAESDLILREELEDESNIPPPDTPLTINDKAEDLNDVSDLNLREELDDPSDILAPDPAFTIENPEVVSDNISELRFREELDDLSDIPPPDPPLTIK